MQYNEQYHDEGSDVVITGCLTNIPSLGTSQIHVIDFQVEIKYFKWVQDFKFASEEEEEMKCSKV